MVDMRTFVLTEYSILCIIQMLRGMRAVTLRATVYAQKNALPNCDNRPCCVRKRRQFAHFFPNEKIYIEPCPAYSPPIGGLDAYGSDGLE
jgi:hypothetical protein